MAVVPVNIGTLHILKLTQNEPTTRPGLFFFIHVFHCQKKCPPFLPLESGEKCPRPIDLQKSRTSHGSVVIGYFFCNQNFHFKKLKEQILDQIWDVSWSYLDVLLEVRING